MLSWMCCHIDIMASGINWTGNGDEHAHGYTKSVVRGHCYEPWGFDKEELYVKVKYIATMKSHQ